MAHVTMTEHFEAPIEQVFDLLMNIERWPEWMPGLIDVKEVTGPLDTVGTRIHEEMRLMGRKIEGWDEVVEVDRPRLWKIATPEGGGMKGTATYRLTPAGTGTNFEGEGDYELPMGVLGQVADRLFVDRAMERQMRHALENFKAIVEAKALVHA